MQPPSLSRARFILFFSLSHPPICLFLHLFLPYFVYCNLFSFPFPSYSHFSLLVNFTTLLFFLEKAITTALQLLTRPGVLAIFRSIQNPSYLSVLPWVTNVHRDSFRFLFDTTPVKPPSSRLIPFRSSPPLFRHTRPS